MGKKQTDKRRSILSVPLDPELKGEIDRLADDVDRTTANYVRLLLQRHVQEARAEKQAAETVRV